MFELRDFYYLDQRSVMSYLSTIEEGLVSTIQQSSTTTSPNWNFEVSTGELQKLLTTMLNLPALPSAKVGRKGKESSISINITKDQTIDSRYDKLFKYLDPVSADLNEFSRDTWFELEQGQFVYFKAKIRLPDGYNNVAFLEAASGFMDLADSIGVDTSDFKEKNELKSYLEKASSQRKVNMYVTPLASPEKSKFYFYSPIAFSNLEDVDIDELQDSEYEVFARIDHKLTQNEKIPMYDMTQSGIAGKMNRQQIRANGIVTESVQRPAMRLKTIAIYKK